MGKLFTFILSSDLIGCCITQYAAESVEMAWIMWENEAADWIVAQLTEEICGPKLSLLEDLRAELHELLLLPDLRNVWLADLLPGDCQEVMEVIIVGPS